MRAASLANSNPRLGAFSRGPLVLSYFVDATFGVARGGRLTALALKAAGYRFDTHNLESLLHSTRFRRQQLGPALGGVWIIHANAPEAIVALTNIKPSWRETRYIIGYWVWELEEAPKDWIEASRFFNEIWVPSAFAAHALRGCLCPVHVAPHFIEQHSPAPLATGPQHQEEGCVFLAMADFKSSAARKNPMAVVKAYLAAFPTACENIRLVLKINQHEVAPNAWQELTSRKRDDITIITETLSEAAITQLIANCDVYVSLHRAEGFGLGIAEAFASGKPAIVTAWSGNLDFTTKHNAILIPYEKTLIPTNATQYGHTGQTWAEPSIPDAAKAMQLLAGDRARRRKLGTVAWSTIAALNRQTLDQLRRAKFQDFLTDDVSCQPPRKPQ
jgi:glycosyltransferase involved in cell wall biosynthesis